MRPSTFREALCARSSSNRGFGLKGFCQARLSTKCSRSVGPIDQWSFSIVLCLVEFTQTTLESNETFRRLIQLSSFGERLQRPSENRMGTIALFITVFILLCIFARECA